MVHLLLFIIYLAFISLGLPDGLLGAAWPTMYPEFGVPVSYAGLVSMIISVGTIVSSLQSDRLTKRFGTGVVTTVSVMMTAVALLGFSTSHSFLALCLWSVPYGLGAGGVDASINNYVALHYASRHMSWLHCMWGIGAATGPQIMGHVLTKGASWNAGYRYVGMIQIVLTAILLFSLPIWKKRTTEETVGGEPASDRALTLREIFHISGAKEVMVMFFCYCAVEQTAGLWAASYLALFHSVNAETAAQMAALFYTGITIGRAISGFMTMRFCDAQMIRIGEAIILLGLLAILFPFGTTAAFVGLVLVGLGCAPVYPCVIHSTPEHFGADKSQAIIGVQMACAYIGTCLMPPLFGLIANHISIALFPVFLLVILLLMAVMHERLEKIARGGEKIR